MAKPIKLTFYTFKSVLALADTINYVLPVSCLQLARDLLNTGIKPQFVCLFQINARDTQGFPVVIYRFNQTKKI